MPPCPRNALATCEIETQELMGKANRKVTGWPLYRGCSLQALLTPKDAVLSDELNHASIIDGIRLCKAHKYRYRHLDMGDLEAKLQEAQVGEAQVWGRAVGSPQPPLLRK